LWFIGVIGVTFIFTKMLSTKGRKVFITKALQRI